MAKKKPTTKKKRSRRTPAKPKKAEPELELGRIPLEHVPFTKVDPAPYNPRVDLQPGDPEFERLTRSIEQHGYIDPLVWNKRTGHLVGGHQRLKVLKLKGCTSADMVVIDCDLASEKAKNLALNKVGSDPELWVPEQVASMLADISELEDVETGFTDDEVEQLLGELDQADAKPRRRKDDEPPKQRKVEASFQVVAMCRDEEHQKEVYDLLNREKHPCRVLTLY